jgi:cytochrome b pre-mRNA-processing protein 3
MLGRLFKRDPLKDRADALYRRVAEAAREPRLFALHGVPDTVEGRFEALSLHVFLVLDRLDRLGAEGRALAQEFVDRFFADLDGAVRAIGIGDLSVGKKVKAYARNFYGRVEAYRAGLAVDAAPAALDEALSRNLFGLDREAPPQLGKVAAYVLQSRQRLEAMDVAAIESASSLFAEQAL